MRLVLLIATLWLLFDVILVATLVSARQLYVTLWRLRATRAVTRSARAGHS
jgi:hypothetical protein